MKNQGPQQQPAGNPMFDMFNQPMQGSVFRVISAEQFKELEDAAPTMAPWLITNEFSPDFHIQTILRTDCAHYFTLNAQTRNLLCRSYTDKISCPKHTGICFSCRRTVCTSGNPCAASSILAGGTTMRFWKNAPSPNSGYLNLTFLPSSVILPGCRPWILP